MLMLSCMHALMPLSGTTILGNKPPEQWTDREIDIMRRFSPWTQNGCARKEEQGNQARAY